MTEQPLRICILGGGFGGLYTALRLHQLPWKTPTRPEIVLVDKNDRFLFSPLLYELLTDELKTWEISPPYEEVLADTGVRFVQGCVTGIDTDSKQVQLEDAPPLNYDKLAIALGGYTPLNIVPGAGDHAIPFRHLSDVYAIEERLRKLENEETDTIRVAVVGGGYIGVEVACKLADRLGEKGRIRIIELADGILRTSTEYNRQVAQKALDTRKVWVDVTTKVESVAEDTITLLYKGQSDVLPVDLVIWTVGTSVTPMMRALPFPHNERGQLLVDATLQVQGEEDIFALGDLIDCRDATGQQVPNTAQAAFQQSDYCGWNIWASVTGRPLLPFRYKFLGEMMTLGKYNGVVTSQGMKLEGYPAYLLRRLAYLSRMPSSQHRLSVGMNWITSPVLDLLAQ